ncbi:PREDICTED: uncharacterized protein LOC109350194 isoform X1 [Lupinus angustifolius]|uniref:uncharacterized protein LOC109350194 isoform X1 n=1 Tax=Lupinus angustifolius TaxID=3871 RepID=UPI00092F9520|nr:PREDICTED: uncharacterized protein LOC109350194 isoform X1 [Lupinus angustifolius]
MFVKKLVEKASIIKPSGNSLDGLKASDVDPHLVFHQGVPSRCTKFAYDNIHKILSLSTKDGRIKLFGEDNGQALLESSEAVPSKFLQFIQNQGILINVTSNNHIEVWDIDKKLLSDVYVVKEIVSFAVIHHSLYIYIGDSIGNISVLKLDREPWKIIQMKYTIPLSASYGNSEVSDDTAVTHILPQPAAESRRVLIVFRNGQIVLWDIRESKSVFRTGGNMSQPLYNETKKVTSACWACPFGSKVVVGYNNGELFIWSITSLNIGNGSASDCSSQNTPSLKLNLGYKSDKISIGSIKWVYAEGKATRLYVMGASDNASSNLLQVVLLNELTESRTIKSGLHLPECCIDMEIISTSSEQSKQQHDFLLMLGKSGRVYQYDDSLIEKYLLQSQSKSTPSILKEVVVKIPMTDSSITTAKFISNNPSELNSNEEYYKQLVKNYPLLIPAETIQKEGISPSSAKFTGFSKVQNLYITGHSNGAINFWDASCPFFTPILQLRQQSENDFSLSGIPLTALYFDCNSPLLVSGDQSGTVRVFRFKPEPYATNSFMSLTGSTKKGNDHIIHSVKLVKINGAILSMNINHCSTLLAVGSDQGHVSVFNIDEATLIYQKHIPSEISAGIISLQFQICKLHGFEKNILAVGTKDSSFLALDSETGNTLSSGNVHPKKPSRALLMQVLDGQGESNTKDGIDLREGIHNEDSTTKQMYILLCSEKALYVYSLVHAVQGIKKVLHKKFHSSSCCWASIFYGPSDVGIVLLFTNGQVELRCLPELSLIVETSIRGFTYSPPTLKSFSDSNICCSSKGDIVLVNGDQEIFVISLLVQRNIFRLLDFASCIYKKEKMLSEEELVSDPVVHKEKKKGIFSSIIKDITGSKEKHVPVMESEDSKESIQELSLIFSNENFPCDADSNENLIVDEEEVELNIDDIDLDDDEGKHKEHSILGGLSKKKLAGKFQALKGKFKEMKGNNQKTADKEEQHDDQAGSVDQIKKKYGFSSSSTETSVAKLAENKLKENINKLQGINLRTTEMEDTAKSFSALANEVLRKAEEDRQS